MFFYYGLLEIWGCLKHTISRYGLKWTSTLPRKVSLEIFCCNNPPRRRQKNCPSQHLFWGPKKAKKRVLTSFCHFLARFPKKSRKIRISPHSVCLRVFLWLKNGSKNGSFLVPLFDGSVIFLNILHTVDRSSVCLTVAVISPPFSLVGYCTYVFQKWSIYSA